MRKLPLQLDHLNLYVEEVARSREFYLRVLAPFGYRLLRDFGEDAAGLGTLNYAILGLVRAQPGFPSTHLAFSVSTHGEVERFHAAALAAGGRDNGAPGLRPHYHPDYYAAFVIDPDGHNLEVVCHTQLEP
jgi:catechol 2,3-dioxygenase-like lactoylglutathione lyase family enzyme